MIRTLLRVAGAVASLVSLVALLTTRGADGTALLERVPALMDALAAKSRELETRRDAAPGTGLAAGRLTEPLPGEARPGPARHVVLSPAAEGDRMAETPDAAVRVHGGAPQDAEGVKVNRGLP